MVNCPYCGTAIPNFKKEWNYAVFHVKLYVCSRCGKSVKVYYRDDKFSHTIPKKEHVP